MKLNKQIFFMLFLVVSFICSSCVKDFFGGNNNQYSDETYKVLSENQGISSICGSFTLDEYFEEGVLGTPLRAIYVFRNHDNEPYYVTLVSLKSEEVAANSFKINQEKFSNEIRNIADLGDGAYVRNFNGLTFLMVQHSNLKLEIVSHRDEFDSQISSCMLSDDSIVDFAQKIMLEL